MVIQNSQQLGQMVRHHRREKKITQKEAAALCNVGTRFLSELENGKPTLQLQKVLQVLSGFGFLLHLEARLIQK